LAITVQSSSVGDIDGFVTMLRAACEDRSMHATLDKILTLPNHQRHTLLEQLLQDMRRRGAPADLMAAIACLSDDQVAEQAYKVIFQCPGKRGLLDYLLGR
jgi:hypothetical protein